MSYAVAMNNEQFRRLLLNNASSSGAAAPPNQSKNVASTPASLGSRMRSSIPMTPRSVIGSGGVDFARQLREQRSGEATDGKKFRSSAAPKGTKLAAGYQDRTQLRTSQEEDDKASRVKALEDLVRLGQLEYASFEKLRDEIVGGDVQNVHLVKGLDRKLLERVRRGEDVLKSAAAPEEEGKKEKSAPAEEEETTTREKTLEVDVDAALDELEGAAVAPRVKEAREKKGSTAVTSSSTAAGKKRTRDDILKELKASRLKNGTSSAAVIAAAAAQPIQPALGPKFRKLGAEPSGPRIERDERGREVLVTTDADGNVKRKVRKAKPGDAPGAQGSKPDGRLAGPAKDAPVLGTDVTVPEKPARAVDEEEEEDIGDIFEGVGVDYDPLGQQQSDDDDSSGSSSSGSESEPEADEEKPSNASPKPPTVEELERPPKGDASTARPSAPRNYFGREPATAAVPSNTTTTTVTPTNPLKDPTILAALKRASNIAMASGTSGDDPSSSSTAAGAEEAARRLARRKEILSGRDRDADDVDMGFGGSRFDDLEEEEGEGKRIRLSEWKGGTVGVQEEGEGGEAAWKNRGGTQQRKRGKKKKKGDGNNAKDVMAVLDRRRA